jgi:hypothetical protein
MKNFFYALMITIITSVSYSSYAQNTNNYSTHYKKLLSRYVSNGERNGIHTTLINYKSWENDPLHRKTMEVVQQTNPDLFEFKEKMAFWINVYNLLTIDLIIQTGEKNSIKNQGSLFQNVWKVNYWIINNKKYTLDKIEHQILRPMGDPRIHMAINCASLSCPDLRTEPFTGKKLEIQLEEQTQLFIQNKSKGVKITKSGLQVSKIFDWFSEDFVRTGGVENFINKQLHSNYTNLKISKYLYYDWVLNSL